MENVETNKTNKNNTEDLAWLLFQLKLNEQAKAADIITESMYIFAKESLQNDVDKLKKICYTKTKKECFSYGFNENTQAT